MIFGLLVFAVGFGWYGGRWPITDSKFFEPQSEDSWGLAFWKRYTRPLWPLAACWYCLFAALVLWAYEWRLKDRPRLLSGVGAPVPIVVMAEIAYVFLAMYVADLVFCTFHFYFDQSQVRPSPDHRPGINHWRASFQRHHRDPVEIFKVFGKDYYPLYSGTETVFWFTWSLPLACLLFNVQLLHLYTMASPWIVMSQPIHYFNHAMVHGYPVPLWFKVLQKMHFVQHFSEHSVHHATFDRDFAVTNGWSNPLMNILYKRTGVCEFVLTAIDILFTYPRSEWGLRVEEAEVQGVKRTQEAFPQRTSPKYGTVTKDTPTPTEQDIAMFERAGVSATPERTQIDQGWEHAGRTMQRTDYAKV